jgi:hypothetical protein
MFVQQLDNAHIVPAYLVTLNIFHHSQHSSQLYERRPLSEMEELLWTDLKEFETHSDLG